MKIYIQWSKASPQDYVEIDSSEWASLPKKPLPTGGETIDNRPGWIHSLDIQGIVLSDDHYHVQDLPDGSIKVTTWHDDLDDWEEKDLTVFEWTIHPLTPDPEHGGAWNTKQFLTVYCHPDGFEATRGPRKNVTVKDISEFVSPPEDEIRHGVWTPEPLHEAHNNNFKPKGWREFTEGVPSRYVRNGKLLPQKPFGLWAKPKGTTTWWPNNTNDATTAHAATIAEWGMDLTVQTAKTSTASEGTTTAALAWVWNTPDWVSGGPAIVVWPDGDYRFQYDITINSGNFSYGLLTIGGVPGHFGRVNHGLTSHVPPGSGWKEQDASADSGTGVKTAVYDSVAGGSWTDGNISDRLEIAFVYQRGDSHGTKDLTIDFGDADGFVDGPWTPAPTEYTIDQTADALLLQASTTSGLADAILAAAVSTYTISPVADALLLQTTTIDQLADALLMLQSTKSGLADAITKFVGLISPLADAYLQLQSTISPIGDALLVKSATLSGVADAVLYIDVTIDQLADAILLKATTIAPVADALLLEASTLTGTADGLLYETFTLSGLGDGLLLETKTLSGLADAIIDAGVMTYTITPLADALLALSSTKTGLADAFLVGTVTSQTADALLSQTPTTSGVADAILLQSSTKTGLADALLMQTQTTSQIADAILIGIPTISQSADAYHHITDCRWVAF